MTGTANDNHVGVHTKNYSPETPWVHPDAVASFALSLQHSKKKVKGDKKAVDVSKKDEEEDKVDEKVDYKEEDEEDDEDEDSSELSFK